MCLRPVTQLFFFAKYQVVSTVDQRIVVITDGVATCRGGCRAGQRSTAPKCLPGPQFLYLCQAMLAGESIMFSACPFVRPSVRSFVCYQTCEHDILKTTEPVLTQTSTRGYRQKATEQKATGQKATETKGHRTQRQDATELSRCATTTTSGLKKWNKLYFHLC